MTLPRRLMLAGVGASLLRPAHAADPDVVAAALREGEVVWYTTMIVNQAVRPMAAAFERAYPGLRVRPVRAGSPETVLKIGNEGRAGRMQADLFDVVGDLGPLLAAGLVARYDGDVTRAYPPELRDKDGFWTAVMRNYMTSAYNTDMVAAADAPHRLDDLLDPKWRGKMAWTAEASVTGPPGFIGAVLKKLGEAAGTDYLKRLSAQQIAAIPSSQRQVLDQTIAGERPLALMTYAHHSVISARQGAPIAWSRFDPVVGSFIYLCMTSRSPHPNAARLLYEFILSREGQTVLADAQYVPARPDVPPKAPELVPDGQFELTTLSLQDIEAGMPRWIGLYRDLFG